MAGVAQLTAAGLQIDTLADIREAINARWRAEFGASMDVSDRSPDGQLIGIAAERFALMEEMLEVINSSLDPNKATDALLDALCALTGTKRRPASFSTVLQVLTGTPTALVPANSLISTVSTGIQFLTTADATIAAATAWAALTTYTAGDRRTNGGNVYICTVGGTSAASGGPGGTTRGVDILDGTGGTIVTWRFLGLGTGFVDVALRATVAGPVVAVAGDLTNKDSPAGGWDDTVNLLDATLGRNRMTDAELRVLRVLELAQPGTSPKDSIGAALLEVPGVNGVTVFNNVSDAVDSNGLPPHSVMALVAGGEDQDIWNALLANVAAGIRTFGTQIGTATDTKGAPQTMAFSRTTQVQIYVSVTLTKDPTVYPADGDSQVALAIATRGNAKPDGTDVVSAAQLAAVFDVPGIINVGLPLISQAPTTTPVSSTTISISVLQHAVFDTSRIVVLSSDGVP